MVTLYFLSGLGSDERIFKNLRLDNCELRYLQWINPLFDESLSSYAKRLSEQVDNDNEIILVGLSFGGIVVQELSKIIHSKSIILLSSIKHENEKPFYLKFLYLTKLYKILPYKLSQKITPLFYRNMGAKTIEEKQLVKEFVINTDISLLRWSVEQIVSWKKTNQDKNLYQIHGDADKVFPIKLLKPEFSVKDGTHFMTYNKAVEISDIISKLV